jgi:hypothetical protein
MKVFQPAILRLIYRIGHVRTKRYCIVFDIPGTNLATPLPSMLYNQLSRANDALRRSSATISAGTFGSGFTGEGVSYDAHEALRAFSDTHILG